MNKYLVTLELRIGEYEKIAYSVEKAENEKEAGIEALKGQCHSEPDFSEFPDMDQVWDMHEMIYSVYSVKEITDEQNKVLFDLGISYVTNN